MSTQTGDTELNGNSGPIALVTVPLKMRSAFSPYWRGVDCTHEHAVATDAGASGSSAIAIRTARPIRLTCLPSSHEAQPRRRRVGARHVRGVAAPRARAREVR